MRFAKQACPSWSKVALLGAALLLVARGAEAGTITITKAVMADKTNNAEVTSGYADAALAVEFRGAATCTCPEPDLVFTWYFGDNTNATGATVTHTYGNAGAGDRLPYLNVECNNCCATADSDYLDVSAIADISITLIGDVANPGANNGRLCFDGVRNVTASALPAGVTGSRKIDWLLPWVPPSLTLVNTPNGNIPSPTPWPLGNGIWGPATLYCMIDSSSASFVPSQDGELTLTGTPSFICQTRNIKTFFDETGVQNPDGTVPNWYYYWKQTAAYSGTTVYDPALAFTGQCRFQGGSWQAFCGPQSHLSAGGGCWNRASGIDFFANICRHENQHVSDMIASWGAAANRVALQDGDGDWLRDALEPGLLPVPFLPYNPRLTNTFNDTYGYTNPAGGPIMDCEDYCLRREPAWANGTANAVDWARPGKQW